MKRLTKRGAAATKRHQQRERSRGQSVYEEPWHMHKQMKVERWRLRGAAPQEARSERGMMATDAAATNQRNSN